MRGRDFQVAFVYNLESAIVKGECQDLIALQCTASTTQHLYEALSSLGYSTIKIAVQDSLEELKQNLDSFSNQDTFIFNNCDGFSGDNLGSVLVTHVIEDLDFKHTGSTAEVIAQCIDKSLAKERLIRYGIPTPCYQVFKQPEGEVQCNFPLIVKPLTEDASLGIDFDSVTTNDKDLFARVDYVISKYHEPAMVEEFIQGRELAVAMWGNETVEALPIAEDDYSWISDPLKCLLTYEAKWIPESPYYQNTLVRCPADLSLEEEQCVVQTAIGAYKAMGLRDFGRVDIRYYNQIPYVIDINEIPDLSPDAGYPRTAMVAGYSYAEMVERLLDFALRREGWR